MARYYFDIHNGSGPVTDSDGLEMESAARIESEVARILTGIARDEFAAAVDGEVAVEVRNEAGTVVFYGSLTFQAKWTGVGG
ncbi:hypothetical protein LJR030_000827 [Rhizobium sp. LjRoot30]|uniref:DUF6894 family protein n=1 Tax=Rhizobium sp. LjRoot30 TaxID=3342320 RepID=UPI003ED01802